MPDRPPHVPFMARALAEAARARGRTGPNPLVGCVVAHGRELVSVGHHERAGEAHAEIIALRRAGVRACGADVYVTLEPCSHVGRTGPCVDALVAARVARVFVATRDPNPKVLGRGLRKLRAAGMHVQVGLMGAESRQLNASFEFAMKHGRPWVVAKMAQSLDGRVATAGGESKWITGPAARRAGHALRGLLDAIVVGVGTVQADDPRLTCRVRGGRDPVRFILDTQARTPASAAVVQAARQSSAATWICVGEDAPARRRHGLERAGARLLTCATRRDGRLDLADLMHHLHRLEIRSLLAEGGPTLLGALFDAGLVSRVAAYTAPLVVGGEGARSSVAGRGAPLLATAARLVNVEIRRVGVDWLVEADVRLKH